VQNPWFLLSVFFVAYVLAAECGHWLSFQEKHFASFWPPSGLCLFALIRTPYRHWPKVVFASFLGGEFSDVLFHGKTIWVSAGFSVANTVDMCLGAFLYRRYSGGRTDLADMRQLTALLFSSVVVSPACSALIGAATVKLAEPNISFPLLWFTWWLSVSFGVLIITPLLLTFTSDYTSERKISSWQRSAEIVGVFCSIVAFGAIAFVRPPGFLDVLPIRPFATFILLVWAATRFSLRGASSAVLLLTLIAVWCTTRGYGPFAAKTFFQTAKLLQFFMLACFLTALPLAVTVETRRRLAKALTEKANALQSALDEIKTLRSMLPICSHCKKIRTEDGEWEHLERYLRRHAIADFTHGICPTCAGEHWMEAEVPQNRS